MKLYRMKAFTGPAGLGMVEESDPPHPVSRQVVIRVKATSINFRDLFGSQGGLQAINGGLAVDHIPLCDGAGEVVAVGSEATRFKVGDRVAAIFHAGWIGGPIPSDFNMLGRGAARDDGMLTEYTTAQDSELVHIPDHLSYEEAATLPCAAVTAWYALHGAMPLLSGQSVLVMGTGGVAVFALQFAKLAGARVIATTTSPSKIERLKALGADIVIDASTGNGWHQDVRNATGGEGVDVTVEVGGGGTWMENIMSTRENGRMSLVGALTMSPEQLPAMAMFRGLNLHPTRVGSRSHFEAMNRAIGVGQLRPVIDRVFDFPDAKEALEYFQTGTRVGKVVIRHS